MLPFALLRINGDDGKSAAWSGINILNRQWPADFQGF
jgi:hypothetical protein